MRRIALAVFLASVPWVASSIAFEPAALAADKQKPKTKPGSAASKKVPRPVVKESKPAPKAQEPPKETGGGEAPAAAAPAELRGPTRIDFDDRLIQGQTNKSGAVYLFDRKETGISSMVRRRKSFRQLTLGTIYDR